MAKAPVKPDTTPLGGGKIGLNGTEIWIKTQRVDSRLYTNTMDATGDGDSDPMFVANGFLYGSLSITGWMISGQASGAAATIKAGVAIAVTVDLSANRTISGTLLIQQSRMNWTAAAQAVPFSIAGQFTGAITEA